MPATGSVSGPSSLKWRPGRNAPRKVPRGSRNRRSLVAWVILLLGCGFPGWGESLPEARAEERPLRLATTTSTQNSGILDVLLPAFLPHLEAVPGVTATQVDVIAVGTGKALRLAESGDVDVVIAHAPDLEAAALAEGYLETRHPFMENYFVLLGPPDDPAGVGGAADILAGLRAIADRGAPFVSRGDASGTHHREGLLWDEAGIRPAWPEYAEVGQGMGAALRIAGERGAYVLSDSGTYHAFRGELDLAILSAPEPALANVYSVLPVDPRRHPHVLSAAARALAEWLISAECQRLISNFRRNGTQLFRPLLAPGGDRQAE